MRNVLDNLERSLTVGGCKITNLRYTGDAILITYNIKEFQYLAERVKDASEQT